MNAKTKLKLVDIIRALGIIALICSAVTFLLQGLNDANSTVRLYSFFLFNLSILGTGLICSQIIKERKGAKAAFFTSLSLIPVYALQIGGILYAVFGSPHNYYPNLFKYSPLIETHHYGLMALSFMFLIFISYHLFSFINESRSTVFTGIYTLLNVMLLLPYRGSELTIIIGSLILVILVIAENFVFSKKQNSALVLLIPLALFIGRNTFLYTCSGYFFAFVFFTIGIVLSKIIVNHINMEAGLKFTGSLFVTTALCLLLGQLADEYTLFAENWVIISGVSIGFYQLVCSIRNKKYKLIHNLFALPLIVVSSMIELTGDVNLFSTLLSFFVANALILLSWNYRNKGGLISGVLLLIFTIIRHWELAYDLYAMSPWISLGIFGIFAIISASFIEKYYVEIKEYFLHLRTEIGTW